MFPEYFRLYGPANRRGADKKRRANARLIAAKQPLQTFWLAGLCLFAVILTLRHHREAWADRLPC